MTERFNEQLRAWKAKNVRGEEALLIRRCSARRGGLEGNAHVDACPGRNTDRAAPRRACRSSRCRSRRPRAPCCAKTSTRSAIIRRSIASPWTASRCPPRPRRRNAGRLRVSGTQAAGDPPQTLAGCRLLHRDHDGRHVAARLRCGGARRAGAAQRRDRGDRAQARAALAERASSRLRLPAGLAVVEPRARGCPRLRWPSPPAPAWRDYGSVPNP